MRAVKYNVNVKKCYPSKLFQKSNFNANFAAYFAKSIIYI